MSGIASHHVRDRLIGPLLLSLPWSHRASAKATRTREHCAMPSPLSLPRSRRSTCPGLALELQRRMRTSAVPWLNLAVCPSAACSPLSYAKVPHATAKWAARPPAVSAPKEQCLRLKASGRSQQIKQQGLASMQRFERQGKVLPLCFAHRPNCAFQRTLIRSFASATPYGRR